MSIACSDVEEVTDIMWSRISQWYRTARIGELDERNIPETPVEYAGEIGLELKGKVELALGENTPGIGGILMGRAVITPDSSLIFIDRVSARVHEFSIQDGNYIRSFGRRGEGLGEYRKALFIALGPEGYVYVCDSIGQVVRYDRQGHYIDKSAELYASGGSLSAGLLMGPNGDLLSLFIDQGTKVVRLQRIDKTNWKVKYEIPLSTGKYSLITDRLFPSVWARYDSTLDRLYYLGVNEYKIKEIDASTGKVLRQFGWQPPGFVPMPDKYRNVKHGIYEEVSELIRSISLVMVLNVLGSKYLYIHYYGLRNIDKAYRIIYDIEATDTFKVYSLDRSIGLVATSQDRLYLYRSPSEEAYDNSNGTVEIYAFSPTKK